MTGDRCQVTRNTWHLFCPSLSNLLLVLLSVHIEMVVFTRMQDLKKKYNNIQVLREILSMLKLSNSNSLLRRALHRFCRKIITVCSTAPATSDPLIIHVDSKFSNIIF